MRDSGKFLGIRPVRPTAALVFLGLLGILGGGCGRNQAGSQAEPLPVRTAGVSRPDAHRVISVSGSIEPIRTVRFGFMVPGKLDSVAVEEGDVVEQGQFIASLEAADYRHGLQIAEAKNQEVQAEYGRLKNLHDQGSLTDSDFDKIDAGRREAEANAAIWRKKLADARLTAPMGGIIAMKGVEAGEIVPQGQPVFAVVDIDSVKAVVGVPETEIGSVSVGQTTRVGVPALDNGHFTGRVIGVGAVADPFTRSYSVKIALANPDGRIRAGMIALADIITSQTAITFTVPAEAVVHDPQRRAFVFVLDDNGTSVTRRSVETGRAAGNEVDIISGLNGDETVVIPGRHRLGDGSRVRPVADDN